MRYILLIGVLVDQDALVLLCKIKKLLCKCLAFDKSENLIASVEMTNQSFDQVLVEREIFTVSLFQPCLHYLDYWHHFAWLS